MKKKSIQLYKNNFYNFLKYNCQQLIILFLNIITIDGFLFASFTLLSPIFIILWMFLWIYRQICYNIIKWQYYEKFRGFLSGCDNIWAIEEKTAKSIINIVMTVGVPKTRTDLLCTFGETLLAHFKQIMRTKLKDVECQKLLYNRETKFGFSFWITNEQFNLDDHINNISIPPNTLNDLSSFQNIYSTICNKDLPQKNQSNWEILISPTPFQFNLNNGNLQFPIIFRLHHSVGDGVTLQRFLLEKFTSYDFELENQSLKTTQQHRMSTLSLLKLGFKLPSFLVERAQKQIDKNSAHEKELSGRKIIALNIEKDENHNKKLLTIIRTKKSKIPQATFTDLFVASISKSFYSYFKLNEYEIPKFINAVIPARIIGFSEKMKLENGFSVVIQTLPIGKREGCFLTSDDYIKKVMTFKNGTHQRDDYMINYWIMSFLSGLLPNQLFDRIARSIHNTLVISNLPGPKNKITISNYDVDTISFILPNRGTTGIGISLFSYNGNLSFGLIADQNCIANQNDVNEILNSIKQGLYDLDSNQN